MPKDDSQGELQILQVSDLEDPYIPLPSQKLLLNVAEDFDLINALLDKIYLFYSEEYYAYGKHSANVATGAALKAGMALLDEIGGRIMLFQGSMGGVGCGKVACRLNATLYNTGNEASKMLTPASSFYKDLAKECIQKCIVVDLFIAGNLKYKSLDVATMQPITSLTGGDLYFYYTFDVTKHGEKLYYHIFRNLTRVTVTDVEVKLRVSSSLQVNEYIGDFITADDASIRKLSALDQDKVISISINSN